MKNKNAAARRIETETTNDVIIDAMRDIKAKNIVVIDLASIEDTPAKYFIICEGESTVQVSAIAHNVRKRMKEERGQTITAMEGIQESKWVVLDYFDTVVHVFYPETRKFYDLEGLWNDADFIEYGDL